MEAEDIYKTIAKPSEGGIFKDRNSKFLGFAFPVTNEEEIKFHLDNLKKSITLQDTGAMPIRLVLKTYNIEPMMTENLTILQVCQFMDRYNLLKSLIFWSL